MGHDLLLAEPQGALRARCFHPTGTFVAFPQADIAQSIVARFEQQVCTFPERLAVKTREQQLTYRALNQAANDVAHALLEQCGAGQEPIALLFPKSVPLVVALLGVLKAGKIYMILDPTLPPARLTYMLQDAQARLIVTNDASRALAHALDQRLSCLNLDALDSRGGTENPQVPLAPEDLAYILYTSGSTGVPKGIVENHRNVLHYIMTETNDLHICAADRLTFLASQGRDIFRAVLTGAAVYPIDIQKEGFAGLARWLIQEEITIYNSVASAFRHFVSALTGDEQFPHLRLIKVMGETAYRTDVELYRQHFAAHCIFVNWYGPNETGLLSHYLIDKNTSITTSVVPVGYAVRDKELLICDHAGVAVSPGETGEIAVRSRYLSPGYWRQPDLTRAAFVPVSPGETMRLYRTGDLGCIQADGCLIHLGRQDQQHKIRGYRVEIAEIETALLALGTVKEAVVVVRQDVPEQQRLVAYIVPATTPAPTVSTLRRTLAATLPDYMIPSAFMMLDTLPHIGIGKVDRQALPMPAASRPDLANPYVAPLTPIETAACRIWAEMLGLEQVGIHDHFMELGGHSLLATRIVSRLRDLFRVEVPLRALLEAPTVAEMAVRILSYQAEALDPVDIERWLAEIEILPRP
jgi:amino acid adenylation domain-containing protein